MGGGQGKFSCCLAREEKDVDERLQLSARGLGPGFHGTSATEPKKKAPAAEPLPPEGAVAEESLDALISRPLEVSDAVSALLKAHSALQARTGFSGTLAETLKRASVKGGDEGSFAMSSGAADWGWGRCPGVKGSFRRGQEFKVAKVSEDAFFFTTEEYDGLWTPVSATEHFKGLFDEACSGVQREFSRCGLKVYLRIRRERRNAPLRWSVVYVDVARCPQGYVPADSVPLDQGGCSTM
eukprot:TRINITY_DN3591_c1_g1_i1.p1 TRINITY_DN3591_c1_g1~~TRINITY_DN3591_c1_g1_i1.p1  ORF type:complete len:264 (-),score=42.73 TRINITY_DN3591_c1_g1_i1:93-809(-)